MGNHSEMVKWAFLDSLINALHVELCTLERNLRKCSKLDWDSGKWRKMTSGDDAWQYFSYDVLGKSAYLDKWEQAPCLSSISYLFGLEWTWKICSTRPHLTRPNISQLQWWSLHATAWNEKKIGLVLKLKLPYTVPLKCNIPVASSFSRDGNLLSRGVNHVSREQFRLSRDATFGLRDEIVVSRDSSNQEPFEYSSTGYHTRNGLSSRDVSNLITKCTSGTNLPKPPRKELVGKVCCSFKQHNSTALRNLRSKTLKDNNWLCISMFIMIKHRKLLKTRCIQGLKTPTHRGHPPGGFSSSLEIHRWQWCICATELQADFGC